MGNNGGFWQAFISIVIGYPKAFFKNLSKENYIKLKFALKTESPEKILGNISSYFEKYNSVSGHDFQKEITQMNLSADNKKTFLFISHEATLTGAPLIILKIAEILKEKKGITPIFILCKGGAIEKEFKKVGTTHTIKNREFNDGFKKEITSLLSHITSKTTIEKTYVNSVESRATLAHLNKFTLGPIVMLIHELGNYYPKGAWNEVDKYSDKIIFPAEFVKQKAIENNSFDSSKLLIIGQGLLKENLLDTDLDLCKTKLKKQLNLPIEAKIVLGCGAADARKGVDLFVSTAISLLNSPKKHNNVYFIWLGNNTINDHLLWANRDVEQSGFISNIMIMPPERNTQIYFGGSDIFFLSSRGDPFPCVVHEALAVGLPIVCFDHSNGFVETIKTNSEIGAVCKPGDILDATTTIEKYLEDVSLRDLAFVASRRLVKEAYSFDDYVERILNV